VKLAIVIPGFQSSPADWCIPAFTNLARELSRHAEVHVFALRYPHRRDRYAIDDVQVHSFGGAPLGGKRYPVASTLELWREVQQAVAAEHRRAPFNGILGIWATESGWIATRMGRQLGVCTFVHIAGGELTWIPQIKYGNWGRGLAGWMVRQTLARADRLIVPSGPIRDLLERRAPETADKWLPIPLGVDTSLFSPHEVAKKPPSDPFTFVAVGSLIPVKGYGLMLRSFARLVDTLNTNADRSARLLIVGGGPLEGRVQRAIHELGLQGYVSELGEVPHERLPEIYHNAHCFLHTAWHEAQCMAALEAMACGLPWIGPPVGVFPDLNPPNPAKHSGICVRAHVPSAFAGAMWDMVYAHDEKRKKMSRNARRTILERYDVTDQAQMVLLTIGAINQSLTMETVKQLE
jgi:glycosyltransferase involved in cell wall biosynthesis